MSECEIKLKPYQYLQYLENVRLEVNAVLRNQEGEAQSLDGAPRTETAPRTLRALQKQGL